MNDDRVITVSKAEQIGAERIKTARIHISAQVPRYAELDQQDDFFTFEAKAIERTLWLSLPGGTYDRLLGLMLQRKATHFVVAHGELEEATSE